MPISVASNPPAPKSVAAPLRAIVRAALALEHRVPGEIAIVLRDDHYLRTLNRRWRRIDRATDVLSFPYGDGAARRVDGDLVISLDRMKAQARRYRVSRGRELARLVIHGALHLAGLDHHETTERRHMRAREEQAMQGSRGAIQRLEKALERD
jgi:probable rRNA maturation factor